MTHDLPFLWGAATSSHQVEGGNHNNDWWRWEAHGNIEGGVRSGRAVDHWNRFREDLQAAKELGMNTYRFSVEWSRIEPAEGQWDPEAIEWYRELIAECERLNLLPMLTLHHFTSPQWFVDDGGFTSGKSVARFTRYTEKIVQEFGPRIPLWCTLNEPMNYAFGCYFAKTMPPAVFDPKLVSLASAHLLACHVRAYDLIHSKIGVRTGPFSAHPLMVGIAHNMIDFMPERPLHPVDSLLAVLVNRFYNWAWVDAIRGKKQRFGVPFLIPSAPPVPEAFNRVSADYMGLNYYTKGYLRFRPPTVTANTSADVPIGLTFAKRKEPMSDLGWAVHPKGMRKLLRKLSSRMRLPIYITENGIADGEDLLRGVYLFTHLQEVARALSEGVEILGYYHWSLLDNFEWIKGFKPRFGLLRVDYETMARQKTGSADLYAKIIRSHAGVDLQRPSPEYFGI